MQTFTNCCVGPTVMKSLRCYMASFISPKSNHFRVMASPHCGGTNRYTLQPLHYSTRGFKMMALFVTKYTSV